MKNLSNYLTISQFATKLGVTVPTIRNYVKEGKIQPSMVCGSHMYFSPETVSKYSGMIVGKRGKAENYAVLYVTDSVSGVPNELIDLTMNEKGFYPLESFDYGKEIQPEELDDFNKFCESKSFYEILRAKVKKNLDAEIKKVNETADNELKSRYAQVYSSDAYKKFEKALISAVGDEKDEALRKKEDLDNAYNGLAHSIEEARSKLIDEIRIQYSSESVDEAGNIADNAPKNSGVKYAKLFKALRKEYVQNFRHVKYSVVKHYTVFPLVKNNGGTFETPFENIFSGAYTTIYVINKAELSADWQKVLEIVDKSSVSKVEDLILETKVSVNK